MATEWDDDFYGADCEMDDQMLIATEEEDTEDVFEGHEDTYDREFREKEAEYSIGNQDFLTLEECIRLKNRLKSKDTGGITATSSAETVYPPERKPPIFDFFTVLTAFIVAVILAYYTISSY